MINLRDFPFGLLGLCLFSQALAEPVWCDGDQTLADHPLNHKTLRLLVVDQGAGNRSEDMIQLVGREFEKSQSQVTSNSIDGDEQFLSAFRRLILDHQGFKDFHFTHQPLKNRAFLIKITDPLVFFDCRQTPQQLKATSSTRTNIALAAYAIDLIGEQIRTNVMPVVVASIDQITTSYNNWLIDQGLRQWPWEMVVNGWIHDDDPFNSDAPRSQVVFMRPSAGLEFQWNSQSDAAVDASVGIEPIGWVWYLGDQPDYDKWIGVSALVTLGTNDAGAGVGGLIRYKNYWLGVTDRENEDGLFFFIGLDLHKYLKSDKGFRADLEARLAKLKSEPNDQ